MTRRGTAWAATLCAACLAGGPGAAHATGLLVLEEGFTAVRIGAERTRPGEHVFPTGPQRDWKGNRYAVAGGPPGHTILKTTPAGMRRFATVDGPGDPTVVALWFERHGNLIVVVRRYLSPAGRETPAGQVRPLLAQWGATRAREHVYYRIKGFAERREAGRVLSAEDAGGFWLRVALWMPGLAPASSLIALFLFVCLAVAALVQQAQRDVRELRRRR